MTNKKNHSEIQKEPPPSSGEISPDLKIRLFHAATAWENLSKEVDSQLSPDQEQLNDIKNILAQIKENMKKNDF